MTHSPDVDLVDSNRAQELSFRTPASDLIIDARYLLVRKLALSATVIFLFVLSGCGGGMSTGGTTHGSPGGPPPGSTSRNDLLKGQYALSVASSFLRAAGSFTADGRGNVSNGMEDLNAAGASAKTVTFTGTYSIGSDRRGTASLTGSNGASTLYFTMVSGSRALVMSLDSQADGLLLPAQWICRIQLPSVLRKFRATMSSTLLASASTYSSAVEAACWPWLGFGPWTAKELSVER